MSEYKFDKGVVTSYKSNFDTEKDHFSNTSYSTYKNSYLKTSGEDLVSKMASNLDSIYEKLNTGYSSIDTYWTDYMNDSDSLESSFSSLSACCSNSVVNAYLSSFIDKISSTYYSKDSKVVKFDDFYRNIKIDSSGKVIITMGNDGLTKFEKEFKKYCESQGKDVDVVCYTIDANGNYNLTTANPELKDKENELIKRCQEEGINIRVTEDVRSVDTQNEYYNSGKNVTGVSGSNYGSNHQWGIAFDVYVNTDSNTTEYDEETYERVGQIGKELGLEWGGDWKEYDTPHFQLSGYKLENEDGSTTKVLVDPDGNKYTNPGEYSESWDIDDD